MKTVVEVMSSVDLLTIIEAWQRCLDNHYIKWVAGPMVSKECKPIGVRFTVRHDNFHLRPMTDRTILECISLSMGEYMSEELFKMGHSATVFAFEEKE